jgi:hypothetical protein
MVIGVAEYFVSCVKLMFDRALRAALSFLIDRATPVVF